MYWQHLAGELPGAVARDRVRLRAVRARPGVGAGGDHAVLVPLAVGGERHQRAVVVVERVVVARAERISASWLYAVGFGHVGEQARAHGLQVGELAICRAGFGVDVGIEVLGLDDAALGIELEPHRDDGRLAVALDHADPAGGLARLVGHDHAEVGPGAGGVGPQALARADALEVLDDDRFVGEADPWPDPCLRARRRSPGSA